MFHLGILEKGCEIKTSEIQSFFFLLKNSSVTIGLNFFYYIPYLLSYHQRLLILPFSLLDYSLLKFHKHLQWFVNNQGMLLNVLIF